MKMVRLFSEKLKHGLLAVGTFHPLVDHPDMFLLQLFHHHKRQPPDSLLLHSLILKLPAHSHNLLVQFLCSMSIKITVGHGLHSPNLVLLPLFVQNLLSDSYLIFCHFPGDFHPTLKKLHHLRIDSVNLRSQFR